MLTLVNQTRGVAKKNHIEVEEGMLASATTINISLEVEGGDVNRCCQHTSHIFQKTNEDVNFCPLNKGCGQETFHKR